MKILTCLDENQKFDLINSVLQFRLHAFSGLFTGREHMVRTPLALWIPNYNYIYINIFCSVAPHLNVFGILVGPPSMKIS